MIFDADLRPAAAKYTLAELVELLPHVGHGVGMDGWTALRTFLSGECCCPICDAARARVETEINGDTYDPI